VGEVPSWATKASIWDSLGPGAYLVGLNRAKAMARPECSAVMITLTQYTIDLSNPDRMVFHVSLFNTSSLTVPDDDFYRAAAERSRKIFNRSLAHKSRFAVRHTVEILRDFDLSFGCRQLPINLHGKPVEIRD